MKLLAAAVTGLVLATSGLAPSGAQEYDGALSTPVEDTYYPTHGEPYFDALAYHLDLRWKPRRKELSGVTTITFRVTEARTSLTLDLGRPLEVARVLLDGAPATYTRPDDHLVIESPALAADSRHTLEIGYRGSPRQTAAPVTRSDIPGLGWKTRKDGSVWTMQEPWGASTWFPSNDHPSDKAYYSARIATGDGMTSVFNGKRTSARRKGAVTTTTWRLDQPASPYLVTIAIGHYRRTTARGPRGLPLSYYVPRGAHPRYLSLLRRSPEMLRWLEKRLGRYPFARAGAVVVPAESAMETQTMITMGSGIWQRDYPGDVLLHEYAHQWLGDTVTCETWRDLWLNEGLTMYLEFLWASTHGGFTMDRIMRNVAGVEHDLRSSEGPPGAFEQNEFGSTVIYYSGALMLHRIRKAVGDQVFFQTLKAWPQEHRNTVVDRNDFVQFWSARTGKDLSGFVNTWLTAEKAPPGP